MPLHERVIQPINVSRSTLPLPPGDIKPLIKNSASISGQGLAANAAASANINIVNELECVTNGTLANLIRQLSSLSRQAEELLTGVFDEASKILNRTVVLQQRIDGLAVKVETLDQLNEVSITLRNPTNHPETFASDMLFNQQVFSKQQLPTSIAELYKNCDEPPPLSKLDPYRDDGKDSLKFYTDPTYFFELWKKDMLKSQQQYQSSAQNNTNNQPSQRQSQQSMGSNRTLQNSKRSSQQSQLPNQQSQLISTMPQTQQIIYVHREQGQQQPMPQTTSQPQLIKQHQLPQQQQQLQHMNQIHQGQQNNDMNVTHNHHNVQQHSHQNNQMKPGSMQYDQQQLQQQTQKCQNNMSQVSNLQANQDQFIDNSQSMGNIGPPPPPALSPLPPPIDSSPAPPPALSPLPPQVAPPQPPAAPTPPPPPPPPPAPPAPSLPQLPKPATQQMFAPPMVTAAQLQQKQSQLKKAEPALPRDPRSDLLAAIKQGISLKKVEQTRKEQAEKQQGMGDTVAAILARRIAVQDSDYEDNDDDDEDNEWDESSNQ